VGDRLRRPGGRSREAPPYPDPRWIGIDDAGVLVRPLFRHPTCRCFCGCRGAVCVLLAALLVRIFFSLFEELFLMSFEIVFWSTANTFRRQMERCAAFVARSIHGSTSS
jgi:hypothetical protein